MKAEIAFGNGSFIKALTLYSEIYGNEANNIECLLKRSECFEKLNEMDLALNDILIAMEIDEMKPRIHSRLIDLNLRIGVKKGEKIQENYKKSQTIVLRANDSCKNEDVGEFQKTMHEVAENSIKTNGIDDQADVKVENDGEGS